MSCRSRLRVCSSSGSCVSAALRSRNATVTSWGPAVTNVVVRSRASISLAAADMLASGHRVVGLAADLGDEEALAVDGDLELVRPLEARHVADDVAHQEDVERVLAVERKVVLDLDAAARAERQAFDVARLRRGPRAPGTRPSRPACRGCRPPAQPPWPTPRGTARATTAIRAARPRCCRSHRPRRRPAGARTRRRRARAGRARRCRTRCGSNGGSRLGRARAPPARLASRRRSR